MNEVIFLVQGSAEEPYEVIIRKEQDNLTALCSCPAGLNRMYCKHRFRILSGSKEGIVSDNGENVDVVKNWIFGSDVENALKELFEAENEMEAIKKKVSALKKKLARTLMD
jgi:uncharacterized Zn finger protein